MWFACGDWWVTTHTNNLVTARIIFNGFFIEKLKWALHEDCHVQAKVLKKKNMCSIDEEERSLLEVEQSLLQVWDLMILIINYVCQLWPFLKFLTWFDLLVFWFWWIYFVHSKFARIDYISSNSNCFFSLLLS